MSFCQNCGRTLPDNSSVCPNCPSPHLPERRGCRRRYSGLKRIVADGCRLLSAILLALLPASSFS